ncbi:MAG: hypothetical protein H6528_07270 [Actinobacteria bacterium]|nr:hypothetical protein [Actinomycetota bacterium]MCB9425188.1 hypothetical protein [Actinomycetota bacterium]
MQSRGRATSALAATQLSLDRLGRSICASLFVVAGVWFALPLTEDSWAERAAALVCAVAAIGVWLTAEREDRLSRELFWLIPPTAMVTLAVVHVVSRQAGWWAPSEVAAVGALVAAATGSGLLVSVMSAAVILVATLTPSVMLPTTLATVGGLNHYRTLQLVTIYLLPLIGVVAMRRAARQADAAGPESEARLGAELLAASRVGAQAAVQRVLHDTVLNTLETVANGVKPDQWTRLQQRCLEDLDAVNRIADVRASREVADFTDGLLHLGIQIRADVQWLSDPPPLVREAVFAALGEAVRNAARHSGAEGVAVHAKVSADSVLVEVFDEGVGFGPTDPDRLGVRTSIVATMESVGGFAEVVSAPGEGTRVSLTWDRARARVSSVLSDLRRGLILVLAATVAASLLLYVLFTVLDPGMGAPGTRLLTIVVAAGVVALLVSAALRDAIGWPEFVAVLGGLVLVTATIPLGDPFCTSFRSTSPFDLRGLVMLAVALAVVTVRPLISAIGAVVLTSAVANLLWLQIGSTCAWAYALTSWVAASFAVGVFWFARTLEQNRRVLAEQAVTDEQDLFAQAQREARMAQMSAWNGREVRQAVGLLQEIVAGEPDSPRLRRRARDIAQRVRQWLLLIGTVGPVPGVVTALLRHWPNSPEIRLDGDPAVVDDSGPDAQDAAARLDAWVPRVAGAAVGITVSRTGQTASVLAHSDTPGACPDPDAWSDEDGWWLHLTWEPATTLTEV